MLLSASVLRFSYPRSSPAWLAPLYLDLNLDPWIWNFSIFLAYSDSGGSFDPGLICFKDLVSLFGGGNLFLWLPFRFEIICFGYKFSSLMVMFVDFSSCSPLYATTDSKCCRALSWTSVLLSTKFEFLPMINWSLCFFIFGTTSPTDCLFLWKSLIIYGTKLSYGFIEDDLPTLCCLLNLATDDRVPLPCISKLEFNL